MRLPVWWSLLFGLASPKGTPMLTLPTRLRVFAKTGPSDMRRSFEGLVGLVERATVHGPEL